MVRQILVRLGAGRRPSPAMIVALLALTLSVGGNAAAAVIINANGQIAKNVISGHLSPSGDHANIIAGSINSQDLSAGVKSSLRDRCKAGLQQDAGLCFDPTPNSALTWQDAFQACADRFLRLASIAELGVVFENGDSDIPNEWSSDIYYNSSGGWAITVGQSNRVLLRGYTPIDGALTDPYRCVSNATE